MLKQINHYGHFHLMDLRRTRKIFCRPSMNRLKSFGSEQSLLYETETSTNMYASPLLPVKRFLDPMGESFYMSKMDSQTRSKSLPMHAMTSKAPSRLPKEIALELTHLTTRSKTRHRGRAPHSVHQTLLLLDSHQPLVRRPLVQRQHLASNRGRLPLGHLLLVPLPSARLLPLVSPPSLSLLSGTRPRIAEGFLPLQDRGHQHSQPPGPIPPLLLDQSSDSPRSAVLVARLNQVNQYSALQTLPLQIQPSEDPAHLAQLLGPDLGKHLLTTRPLLLGNLRRPHLQHLVNPPYLPLHRLYHHSANLRQIPQRSVNQRRHLVSPPPPLLPLARMPQLAQLVHSVNPPLPLPRERRLNSRPLAEAYHLYRQADPLAEPSPMQRLLRPILQTRGRRTGRA